MRLKIRKDFGSRAIILKNIEAESRIKDTVNRQNFSLPQRTDQISELIFSHPTSEMLCELIGTIVVLKNLALIWLVRVSERIDGFLSQDHIFFSLVLVAPHILTFIQQAHTHMHTHTHTHTHSRKRSNLCSMQLRDMNLEIPYLQLLEYCYDLLMSPIDTK